MKKISLASLQSDDRYYTKGVTNDTFSHISFYTPEQYELAYPLMVNSMPGMFSLNLREEIETFIISVHPMLNIPIDEVVSLACYYYSNWDSVKAITDDVVKVEALVELRRSLINSTYDAVEADKMLDEYLAMLTEALQKFISTVIGTLARMNIPTIMDYGSCYRLSNLDDYGNVFFSIRSPESVYSELEDVADNNTLTELRGF